MLKIVDKAVQNVKNYKKIGGIIMNNRENSKQKNNTNKGEVVMTSKEYKVENCNAIFGNPHSKEATLALFNHLNESVPVNRVREKGFVKYNIHKFANVIEKTDKLIIDCEINLKDLRDTLEELFYAKRRTIFSIQINIHYSYKQGETSLEGVVKAYADTVLLRDFYIYEYMPEMLMATNESDVEYNMALIFKLLFQSYPYLTLNKHEGMGMSNQNLNSTFVINDIVSKISK